MKQSKRYKTTTKKVNNALKDPCFFEQEKKITSKDVGVVCIRAYSGRVRSYIM